MATNRPCKGDRHFCTAMRAKVPVPFARSVFVRYTLRSLAANRVRTAVTVVGIALILFLLVLMFTLGQNVVSFILTIFNELNFRFR